MEVSNGLQTGDGKQKAKAEGIWLCTPIAPELCASVEEVTCLFYFILVFTIHFTTLLNDTIIGLELFFSCSTSFKNNLTFQTLDGNDA